MKIKRIFRKTQNIEWFQLVRAEAPGLSDDGKDWSRAQGKYPPQRRPAVNIMDKESLNNSILKSNWIIYPFNV